MKRKLVYRVLGMAGACLLGSCGGMGTSAVGLQTMKPSEDARGVCFLKMHRRFVGFLEKDASGAGALIEGRYVLTAAHSLIDPPSAKGDLRRVQVAVGRADVSGLTGETADVVLRREEEDLGRLPADLVWSVAPKYEACLSDGSVKRSREDLLWCDYGFVDLGSDLGKGGGFQLAEAQGSLRTGMTVFVAGYPGESRRVKGATGKKLFVGEGKVTKVRGSLFGYDLETSKGVSGGPIWIEKGERRLLVGIHLGSDIGGIEGAVGRMIDADLLKDWHEWRLRIAR